MYPIKQSTAITLPFFVHDQKGDPVTLILDASITKTISKNGAAFGAMTVTITELANGWYSFPLSTSHSDTVGILTIVFVPPGPAKQVNIQYRVEANLLDDLSTPAQVNTEVDNALTVTTYAEPSAVPAATATLKDKIGWLAMLARNKITQTSTTTLVRNDADAATVGTSTVSDDTTTAIRGEFS